MLLARTSLVGHVVAPPSNVRFPSHPSSHCPLLSLQDPRYVWPVNLKNVRGLQDVHPGQFN